MTPLSFCAACGKPINPKSRYCPHCGHENRVSDPHRNAFCPRCKVALEPYDYRQTDAEICPLCAGLWFDRREFSYLTSERDVYQDQNLPREYQRPPRQNDPGYLSCVRCGTPMTKKLSGGFRGHDRHLRSAWYLVGCRGDEKHP